jgi:hypothetical protein
LSDSQVSTAIVKTRGDAPLMPPGTFLRETAREGRNAQNRDWMTLWLTNLTLERTK